MSGAADIGLVPIAIAMALPVLAVGALAGAAVVAGRGIAAVGKEVHNTVQQQRVNHMARTMGKYSQNLDAMAEQAQLALLAASEQCHADYRTSMQLMAENFAREHDPSVFLEESAKARQQLCSQWQQQQQALYTEHVQQMLHEQRKVHTRLAQEREEMLASMEGMRAEEAAYRAKAEAAAQTALAQAWEMVEALRQDGDRRGVQQLADSLAKAEMQLQNGMEEAAIIGAYSVMDAAVTQVSSNYQKLQKISGAWMQCHASLEELGQLFTDFRSTTYTLKETEETDGTTYEIDDFAAYFLGSWEKMEEKYTAIRQLLESRPAEGFVYEELSDLADQLEDLHGQFRAELVKAYEQLHNNLLRNAYADAMAAVYEELGFVEIEPETDKSPLEATVMAFEHTITGEVIRVQLCPEYDAQHRLQTKVELESHDDHAAEPETEQHRRQVREQLCQGLMQTEAGRKLGLQATHQCRPGTQNKNAF